MGQTIFILGTDPDRCAELREVLQAKLADPIIIKSVTEPLPRLTDSDTVIVTSEEKDVGALYRHILNRLEEQVQRVQVLGELVRLSMTSLTLEELLEKIVAKSTDILGDTSFIVLNSEAKLHLETVFCTDPDRLRRMLISALNAAPQAVAGELLHRVLEDGEAVVISNLQQTRIVPELQSFVERHGFLSLIASPIRTKNRILGAFVSLSTAPKMLVEQDLAPAAEMADFTTMVIENARLVAELQRSATTDSLTGVYNPRFFRDVLSREASRAQRYHSTLSLLMLDVDGFKQVNDTYGHVVGDKVLVEIGKVLEESVRNTDFVFRPGGDEFGVILPGTTAEGADNVAQKIVEHVQARKILEELGHAGTTTVSIGVAEYQRGDTTENLVKNADQALYAAKRAGKNTVRIFGKDE